MKIVISNQGLVEPGAFTLLGASTKRDDKSKIGMFGSGNKYALAYFLRNGYNVRIFSGEREIEVGTITVEFKDSTWEVICIDGERTSITTETGPKWTFWQAVREVYSNAIDEGEASIKFYKKLTKVHHHSDRTSIVIETPQEKVEDYNYLAEHFDHYFLPEDTPYLFRNYGVEIYPGGDGTIYRKGIRVVSEDRKPSIFRYNLDRIDITEDRLISIEDVARRKVWKAIIQCDVPLIVTRFLQYISDEKYWEHNDSITGWLEDDPTLSKTWKKILSRYKVCPSNMGGFLEPNEAARTKFVPTNFYKLIVAQMGEEVDALAKKKKGNAIYKPVKTNKIQENMLSNAVAWMTNAGVNIDYPVEVVHFQKDNIFGLAADQTIFISRKCFDKGDHFLCKVIFEEQMHMEHGVEDETREMQNLYLDKIMSLLERLAPK